MAGRGNEENLVPQNKRSKDEQRKIAAQGGRASGEARRKRKALKEYMEILLTCEPDRQTVNKMLRMGIDVDDVNVSMAVIMALAKEAMQGNVSAFKELRDLVGEAGEKADLNALEKAKEILGGVDSAF